MRDEITLINVWRKENDNESGINTLFYEVNKLKKKVEKIELLGGCSA